VSICVHLLSGLFLSLLSSSILPIFLGTRWRSLLRHYATSPKVAGLIPDGVFEVFHGLNRFSRHVALGSTQSVTEISARDFWVCLRLTALPYSCVYCLKLGAEWRNFRVLCRLHYIVLAVTKCLRFSQLCCWRFKTFFAVFLCQETPAHRTFMANKKMCKWEEDQ
jgi:hypothetical protein